jgi:subtilisin family serine protease
VDLLSRGPDPDALRRVASSSRRVRFVSRWLAAASVEADEEGLARLRREFGPDAVRRVTRLRWTNAPAPSVPVEVAPKRTTASLPYGPSLTQLAQIQVDQLHARGLSGRGIRILVLDTGFWTDHAAFAQLAVADEWDFVFEDPVTANEPGDVSGQHNHGTAVLGTMAGYAPGELVGAAYGAEVLLAKTEDLRSETQLEEDNFVAALEWGEALGADVATASLGYTSFDDGFSYPPEAYDGDTAVTTRAMDDAVALGIVACGAAGNDGPGSSSLMTPGDADSMITVGAVDSLGTVRAFSSRGPTHDQRIKPDVAAQGYATVASTANGGYGRLAGTSMATPLVAGAAALLLELHPDWTPMQLRDAVWTTATQSGAPDNDMGYGLMQAHDAGFAVSDPVYPLPFDEIDPPEGASTSGPVTFRWHEAVDLQTPDAIDYWVHLSSDLEFADTVGMWRAGHDTVRTIDFLPSGSFAWRVIAIDPQQHERVTAGRSIQTSTSTGADVPVAPSWVRVGPPVPNPFNPSVRLSIELREPARLQANLFDAAGRHVRRLLDRRLPAGDHFLDWNGRDEAGRPVSSGTYLARLTFVDDSNRITQLVRRLTLLR